MALRRLITYFLRSSTLLVLLLLPPNDSLQVAADTAAHHTNDNDGNANVIGTSPFICKTSCTVSSSRRTLTISRKPFINPLVVTAATLALYGSVTIVVFWMLFAYLCLKSMDNHNASISLPASSGLNPLPPPAWRRRQTTLMANTQDSN